MTLRPFVAEESRELAAEFRAKFRMRQAERQVRHQEARLGAGVEGAPAVRKPVKRCVSESRFIASVI